MVKRSCLTCKARKVCSSWHGMRKFIGQVTTEHGDYSKHKETYDEIASIIAKVCYIYYSQSSKPNAKEMRE